MHELPITQSICNMAVTEANRIGATRVTEIRIKQGEYTDYVPAIIQEYFNVVSEGTIAENAKLVIEPIPAMIRCKDCGKDSRGYNFKLRCPECNSGNTELLSGKEFYIDSMEVEEEDGN